MGHPFADDYAVGRDVGAATTALNRMRHRHRPVDEALRRVTRQAIAVCHAHAMSVRASADALQVSKSEVWRVYKQLDRGTGVDLGAGPDEQPPTVELITDAWTSDEDPRGTPGSGSTPVEVPKTVPGHTDIAEVSYLVHIAIDDEHDPVSLEIRTPGPLPRVGEMLNFFGDAPNGDLWATVTSVTHQLEAHPTLGHRLVLKARTRDRDVLHNLGDAQTLHAWAAQYDPLLRPKT